MRNWITTILALVMLTSADMPLLEYDTDVVYKDIPVMKVNVYMMGRDNVEEEVTSKILENIDYLNQSFSGHISFQFEELFMDPNHSYLPDLYHEVLNSPGDIVAPVVDPIEKKGAINVYLFETYCEEGMNEALMGFTPMLRAEQQAYAVNSPRFDRILMAYDGLGESKTLVHEMGHFFGLKHPWEMTYTEKYKLGLQHKHTEECNHMSYGDKVDRFTFQQLESMRRYALDFRTYLMDRVVKVAQKA